MSSTADLGKHSSADMTLKHRGAVASRLRPSWAGLSSFDEPMKAGAEKQAHYAPILVSCSGSDEGESSSDQQGPMDGLLQQRNSVTSVLDGAESTSSSPGGSECVAAKVISQADVQAGRFKTGVRYCLETRPNSLVLQGLDAFLAMSSMFGYTATILILVVWGLTAWFTAFWPLGLLTTALVVSVFLPAEPLLWLGFQNSTLVSSWRRYFNFSFVIDQKLDQDGRYIFAGFPHGVFPVSELLCISLMLRIWPKLRVYSICASSVFKVPVWRHILCWTGARPATAQDFRALLQRGSVSLVPGGIAEMFLWEQDREAIKIMDRKGFVRIAVESGTPIVPVYHFGNSKLFSWVAPNWLEWVCRRSRVAVGYPKGRWGTLMPCNAPLMMAVGGPIHVPHIVPGAEGFDEAVQVAHEQLVKALVELYDKYKGLYGWQDRELVVN